MKKIIQIIIILFFINGFSQINSGANSSVKSKLVYSTIIPVSSSGYNDNDTYIVTSNGNSTGTIIGIYKFDKQTSSWKNTSTEPWQVANNTLQATSNTQNIYQIGNVGIGTSNPLQKLDVAGVTRSNDGFMAVNGGSVGMPAFFKEFDPTGMYFPASSTLAFVTAGSERIRLTIGGNFGIATTTPQYLLDVNGTVRIVNTPTITTATKVLVKDPSTGQISEQVVSVTDKYVLNFEGDGYYYPTNWRSLGGTRNVWSTLTGANTANPTYNTALNRGFIISSAGNLSKIKILNRFSTAVGTSQTIKTNVSVIRAGAVVDIITITQSTGVLTAGAVLIGTATPLLLLILQSIALSL